MQSHCSNIASALADCPHLKKLGLGRGAKTVYGEDVDQGGDEILILDEMDLLRSLCLTYGTQPRTQPFKIQTLRLGYSMCLTASTSSLGNYLTKVFDLGTLKNLDIYNGYALQAQDVLEPEKNIS